MENTTMTVLGYDIEVDYEYSCEKDPLGTGDSPRAHYVDICGVYLDGCKQDVLELFEKHLDIIEANIIEEHRYGTRQ
jgi:hypothetical protein